MIGPVHLERAGSLEAIINGKAELVEALPADGTAILNYDDEHVRAMASRTKAKVFTYGLDPKADLWADNIEGLGLEGVSFDLHYAGETLHVHLPLLGQHSVHTAMRASAAGLVEGLNWQEILGGLLTPSTQLRLVAVTGPRNSLLIDDTYNASPDSMIAALNLLGELDGRKVAVLGDMLELGEFEEKGHRMVGARAVGDGGPAPGGGRQGRLDRRRSAGPGAARRQDRALRDRRGSGRVSEKIDRRRGRRPGERIAGIASG